MKEKLSDIEKNLLDIKNLIIVMDDAVQYCSDNAKDTFHLYSITSCISSKIENLYEKFEEIYNEYLTRNIRK